MVRGAVIGRALWVLLAVSVLTVGTAGAQEKGKKKEAAEAESPVERGPARSNHYRNLRKIRRGSVLRSEAEPTAAPDMRGEYERRRDAEVVRHYQRLAELDAIAKIANDAGEGKLASRVDEVRRAELARFRLTMRRLRDFMRAQLHGLLEREGVP